MSYISTTSFLDPLKLKIIKIRRMIFMSNASITNTVRDAIHLTNVKGNEARARNLDVVIRAQGSRVVVTLKTKFGIPRVVGEGVAVCHSHDQFNLNVGEAIAILRALGEEVPEFLTNSPLANVNRPTVQRTANPEAPAAIVRGPKVGFPGDVAPPGLRGSAYNPVCKAELDAIFNEFGGDADKLATALIHLRRYVISNVVLR
jgi:hypothetical protein